jgi:hypothetical protein
MPNAAMRGERLSHRVHDARLGQHVDQPIAPRGRLPERRIADAADNCTLDDRVQQQIADDCVDLLAVKPAFEQKAARG